MIFSFYSSVLLDLWGKNMQYFCNLENYMNFKKSNKKHGRHLAQYLAHRCSVNGSNYHYFKVSILKAKI